MKTPRAHPLLGRYTCSAQVGHGGMGAVYRARDTMLQREVALKMLAAPALSRKMLEHLRREFAIMSQVRHPCLVEVYDFYAAPGAYPPFFTMEYVRGCDLSQGNYDAPVAEKLMLLYNLAQALHRLHQLHILHLDIKPENVMLRQGSLAPVLMDFGISRFAQDIDIMDETVMGTLNYMAPEMVSGVPVDTYSDVYSLGVLFYQLLAGRRPYHITGIGDMRSFCRQGGRTFPGPKKIVPALPTEIDALVMAMLAFSPHRRIRSCQAVLDRLAAVMRRPDSMAPPPPRFIFQSPLHGRESAVRMLEKTMRDFMHQIQPHPVVLVSGTRASGRTRLLQQVKHMAQLQGVLVIELTGRQGVGGYFRYALDLLAQLQGMVATLLESGSARGAHPRPWRDQAIFTQGAQERLHLLSQRIEAIRDAHADKPIFTPYTLGNPSPLDMLRQALELSADFSAHFPVLLVFDDVDADREIANFINDYYEFIAHRGGRCRMMLLAAAQTGASSVNDMASRHDILLAPLSQDALHLLLSAVLLAPPKKGFVRFLRRQTGGRPGYVREWLFFMLARGLLVWRAGGWRVKKGYALLADTDHDTIIKGNVAALSHGQAQVLSFLACAEWPLPYEVLRSLFTHVEDMAENLLFLEKNGFVQHRYSAFQAGAWEIADKRYVRSIMQHLPQPVARTMAQKLSSLLEADCDRMLRNLSMAALVAFRAGRYGRAFCCAKKCILQHLRTYADATALRFLNICAYSLRKLECGQAARVRRKLLVAQDYITIFSRMRGFPIVKRWLLRIKHLAGSNTFTRPQQVRYYYHFARVYYEMGRQQEAQLLYKKILAGMDKQNIFRYVHVLFSLAFLLLRKGDYVRYKQLLQRLQAPVEAAKDPYFACIWQMAFGLYYLFHGQYKQAGPYFNHASALARATGRYSLLASSLYNQAELLRLQDDSSGALTGYKQAAAAFGRTAYLRGQIKAAFQMANLYQAQGNLTQCRRMAQRGFWLNLHSRIFPAANLEAYDLMLSCLVFQLRLGKLLAVMAGWRTHIRQSTDSLCYAVSNLLYYNSVRALFYAYPMLQVRHTLTAAICRLPGPCPGSDLSVCLDAMALAEADGDGIGRQMERFCASGDAMTGLAIPLLCSLLQLIRTGKTTEAAVLSQHAVRLMKTQADASQYTNLYLLAFFICQAWHKPQVYEGEIMHFFDRVPAKAPPLVHWAGLYLLERYTQHRPGFWSDRQDELRRRLTESSRPVLACAKAYDRACPFGV